MSRVYRLPELSASTPCSRRATTPTLRSGPSSATRSTGSKSTSTPKPDLDAARHSCSKPLACWPFSRTAGAEISAEFLEAYAQTSLGLPAAAPRCGCCNSSRPCGALPHKNSYILFEGTNAGH
ncbi:MAG: hypothetical protein WKG07_26575 [Hymenobacter sp.]